MASVGVGREGGPGGGRARRIRRWGLVALAVAAVLVVAAVVASQLAVRLLRDRVVAALGPESEVAAIRVGWAALEVEGLRIGGGAGWPAAEAFATERVVIVPSLGTLLSERIRVRSVTVIRPYFSALRSREGGLRVLPSLLGRKGAGPGRPPAAGPRPAAPGRTVAIERLVFADGVLELFDATVADPPLRVRLEAIQATVTDVVAPTFAARLGFEARAVVKGVRQDGRLRTSGWLEVGSGDSTVDTELRGVDLVALQPYLVRATDARVRQGRFDLDLHSEVRARRLVAPGRLVIAGLEFVPSADPMATFMGLPRAAVVSFLEDHDGRIEVRFALEGDVVDARLRLNETLATRVAVGMAEKLGLSLRGVAEGVGDLGRRGVEAAGEAARGVLRRLLEREPKE